MIIEIRLQTLPSLLEKFREVNCYSCVVINASFYLHHIPAHGSSLANALPEGRFYKVCGAFPGEIDGRTAALMQSYGIPLLDPPPDGVSEDTRI